MPLIYQVLLESLITASEQSPPNLNQIRQISQNIDREFDDKLLYCYPRGIMAAKVSWRQKY